MAYTDINEKLKNLLKSSIDSKRFEWMPKGDIDSSRLRVESPSRPLPLAHVIRIYSIRSQISEEKKIGVIGFRELLENLSSTDFDEVIITRMLDENDVASLIFTDPSETELLGILTFPKRQRVGS